MGGNLSIVYSMLGSDTNLNMAGKILFIEDVGEALYHIDRMMISLKRAGYFENCKGIIVGNFKLKSNESNPFGKSLEEVVLEATEGTDSIKPPNSGGAVYGMVFSALASTTIVMYALT